jgi:hypothetical protein
MASEKRERDPVLAAMEAKAAAWKAAADSYRAAATLDGPLGEPSGIIGSGGIHIGGAARVDLPVGIFRDKTLKDAIAIYLEAGRRKQTNKEISEGLKAGGFPSTAGNFESTVATALYRLKNDGVVLRFPDGWDVASSYPDGLRNRLQKDTAPKKAKRAKKTRRAKADEAPRSMTVRMRRTRPTTSQADDAEIAS